MNAMNSSIRSIGASTDIWLFLARFLFVLKPLNCLKGSSREHMKINVEYEQNS